MPKTIKIGGAAMPKGICYFGSNFAVKSFADGSFQVKKLRKMPGFIKRLPVVRRILYLLWVIFQDIKSIVFLWILGVAAMMVFRTIYFHIFPQDLQSIINVANSADGALFLSNINYVLGIGGMGTLLMLIRLSVYIYRYQDRPVLKFLARLPLIRRLHDFFTYHGAEHKTINYYEARGVQGLQKLDMAYLKSLSTVHPRCGTNLLVILLLIGPVYVYLKSFVKASWYGELISILMLYGIGAEIMDLVLRYNFRPLLWPGMMIQRYLTTYEPSEEQLLIGIRGIMGLLESEQEEDNDSS